jgi:hypothetical protein
MRPGQDHVVPRLSKRKSRMAPAQAAASPGMTGVTKIDRWNLVQEIFGCALELPLGERCEYLAGACGDDEELRSEVASPLPATTTVRSASLRVGGGMGVVYLAVRSDEHYFQIVAVKMLRLGFAGARAAVQ